MKKIWIFIALSGALAVAIGAMSAHLLKDVLEAKDIARLQTAATYQNVSHTNHCYAGCVLSIQAITSH